MLSWKINAVRIPLNEDCWLDVNTGDIDRAYVGASYRNAVIDYVNRLIATGIVVILDLDWAAPGTQQATGQNPFLASTVAFEVTDGCGPWTSFGGGPDAF